MKARVRSIVYALLSMGVALSLAMAASPIVTAQDQAAAHAYLDLSIDPVVPGGIPEELEQQMLQSGWKISLLSRDVYAHVQFQDEKHTYHRDGWLRKGTKVFIPVGLTSNLPFDFGVLQACGNPIILGEEKYGRW